MKTKVFVIVYTLLVAAVSILASALFAKCGSERDKTKTTVRHTSDTVVVTKTDKVYVDRVEWLPGRIDTVFVFNGTDSLLFSGYAKDTVWLERVELKLITRDTVIHDTIVMETTIKKGVSHFGFGVNAGVCATYGLINRKFDVGPAFGVGIIYKF